MLRDATERDDGLGRNAALATEISATAWLSLVASLRMTAAGASLESLPSPSAEISRYVATRFAAG